MHTSHLLCGFENQVTQQVSGRTVQWIRKTFERNGTEVTGTSDGIVSLAEECATGTCVVSGSCTDIPSSVLTGQLGGIKSGPRRDVALLGFRVLRWSQPVISLPMHRQEHLSVS